MDNVADRKVVQYDKRQIFLHILSSQPAVEVPASDRNPSPPTKTFQLFHDLPHQEEA